MLLVTIWYLSYVPLSETGLFAIFFDPLSSAEVREKSLKHLSNVPLKYAYSLLRSTFAPLLAVIFALLLVHNLKRKRIILVTIDIIILVCILVIVTFTGARAPAAAVIFVIILAFFLKKEMPIRPLYIILAAAVTLFIPIILTIFRGGHEFSIYLFLQTLTGVIFDRIFVDPMTTALWHVEYAQNFGYFGVAAIPKLAVLFGIDPVNVANIINLEHFSGNIMSGFSNTCYVFSYYSYFGITSIVISLLALWMLDFAVLVCRKLSDLFLLPCLAAVLVSCIAFISSDYTTVFLTHGFGTLLIVSMCFDLFWRIKLYFPSNRN